MALRRPHESYSEVILRLVELKTPAAQFRELERGDQLSHLTRRCRTRADPSEYALLFGCAIASATLAQLIPIRPHLGQLSRIATFIAEPMTSLAPLIRSRPP